MLLVTVAATPHLKNGSARGTKASGAAPLHCVIFWVEGVALQPWVVLEYQCPCNEGPRVQLQESSPCLLHEACHL